MPGLVLGRPTEAGDGVLVAVAHLSELAEAGAGGEDHSDGECFVGFGALTSVHGLLDSFHGGLPVKVVGGRWRAG